jgi:hypothetical protein
LLVKLRSVEPGFDARNQTLTMERLLTKLLTLFGLLAQTRAALRNE